MTTPEAFDLDLGDGHWLKFVEYEGDQRAGANVPHLNKAGELCNGWIAFAGGAWANSVEDKISVWKVECPDPLTLSPSLLCRACGDHGHVRDGKWVRA